MPEPDETAAPSPDPRPILILGRIGQGGEVAPYAEPVLWHPEARRHGPQEP